MKKCKAGIFYFSGTGNSLYITKGVAKSIENCQLFSIPTQLNKGEMSYDMEVLGFVVPTYYLGLPQVVHEFVEKLEVQGVRYSFVIATKGWGISGGAVAQLIKKLKKKGVNVNYGASVVMPFNDFDFGRVDSKPVQQRKLNKSELRLESYHL